ncbi:polysaccharide biosynthesis protein [Phycisphaerales bacterium AB-hyl4]|uniref:Polysaccharide biosynthesis protein n=1 Tax=Natronomicrosphaera hydrolytica TaxID=3242702 RepID=A0ABV4UAP7_9BACT
MNWRELLILRRPLIIGLHLLLIPLAYAIAFELRVSLGQPAHRQAFLETVFIVTALKVVYFGFFGLYRGWWRYASMSDLEALFKATSLATLTTLGVLYLTGMLAQIPRSILLIDWGLTILIFGGARMAVRMIRESPHTLLQKQRATQPTLIIGAGDTGERLVREMRRDQSSVLNPVVLLDDDPAKRGMYLHGIRVAGGMDDLAHVVRNYEIQMIVIAVPSASRKRMSQIVNRCLETGVAFKTVPSFQELMERGARVNELREVEIEDLLGRESVKLDLTSVQAGVAGQVVLVTGGAGSIGSELARQVARLKPSRLVLLEQSESDLYFIDLELRNAHPGLEIIPVIGDVADRGRMAEVFAHHRPAWVLHAAAYKHVPMMEHNLGEAVRNNVMGTLTVARCAARFKAEKFVLVSTDKAVNPSSVMGASKRIAERIVLGSAALRTSDTDFRAVRFGNVLESNGSVIPLFKQQVAKGGPLTVTHPEMTRYFMTIPEASQLVLLAAALPEAAGRICMLDMGEPVKILDLARNLIRLYGMKPDVDVKIEFTGLRPGEKMHEELMSQLEAAVPTSIGKIRLVQTDEGDPDMLELLLHNLHKFHEQRCDDGMLRHIGLLVPECVPPLRERWLGAGGDTSRMPARQFEPVAPPMMMAGNLNGAGFPQEQVEV